MMKKRKGEIKFSTKNQKHIKNGRFIAIALPFAWKISPFLTGTLIKYIFFQPRKYILSTKEKEYKNIASAFEFKVRNKKIKAWKWGHGPPILLVHGWNSAGLQLYKFINPLLERGYSVVTYDKPAHGESQGIHSSYFEFTDVLRNILHHPILKDISGIIGHSMGASAVVNAVTKESFDGRLVFLAPALPIREMLFETITGFGIPENILSELLKQYEKQYHYSIKKDNPINLIQELNAATLIIHDRNDRATPYEYSKRATEMNSRIKLITSEGLGHGKLLFDDGIIEQSVDFLTETQYI